MSTPNINAADHGLFVDCRSCGATFNTGVYAHPESFGSGASRLVRWDASSGEWVDGQIHQCPECGTETSYLTAEHRHVEQQPRTEPAPVVTPADEHHAAIAARPHQPLVGPSE